jgi:26S proteasome regulatory subunit N4
MTTQEQVLGLIKRKDEIEAELLGIVEELNSPGQDGKPAVGLKGNLVDREGFPRNDIDIMRITTSRNRHAILNTDLAELMKQIEHKLHELHASVPKPQSTGKRENFDDPFLKVNTCQEGSPAHDSGLREGDLVTKLSALTAGQFARERFPSVAAQVVEGKPIRVHVLRNGEYMTFSLTPRKWNGQGLLGCHLVEIKG